jgi:ribosomal protein L33
MAKKKKGPRALVALKSTVSGNITHYTYRNKRNRTEKGQGKLRLVKYDPTPGVQKHVEHVEVEKLK